MQKLGLYHIQDKRFTQAEATFTGSFVTKDW